jgi:hypothetical protein
MWPRFYILIDHLPVAVDLMTWATWLDTAEHQVGVARVGNAEISTVFLGLDHNFRGGEPILFETMIFGGPLDGEAWRYATYQEAERGHAEAVTQAKIAAAKIKSIADQAMDGTKSEKGGEAF